MKPNLTSNVGSHSQRASENKNSSNSQNQRLRRQMRQERPVLGMTMKRKREFITPLSCLSAGTESQSHTGYINFMDLVSNIDVKYVQIMSTWEGMLHFTIVCLMQPYLISYAEKISTAISKSQDTLLACVL